MQVALDIQTRSHYTYNMMKKILFLACIILSIGALGQTWNNPHTGNLQQNVRYSAFSGPPKTLDPARAYSSDEIQFIAQIYEPPLQYHYLKRPFELTPLTATKMPTVTYYNAKGQKLPLTTNPKDVAYSIYNIYIKPNIYYQPHPALAKNKQGQYVYHNITVDDLNNVHNLGDFKKTGTRELTAEDFVYQIKRLADPKLNSPIYGFMNKYILGLKPYAKILQQAYDKATVTEEAQPYVDLRKHPIEGAKVISRYHYQIKIKGAYPQFKFWLAMPFFAPVPWEAIYFYSQPGMLDRNITMDWYPIGTGPYELIENNPNKQMVLQRNPNFRGERYPSVGEPTDKSKGYLIDANKKMPFVDKFIFSLDKESIPRWNKFLQGYYDKSGVSADSFDQAIKIDKNGKPILTDVLKKKGIQLNTTISPSIYYMGFNMIDNIVGGYGIKQKKLRQAIAIALDYEEYISIFMNGRGIPAQGPIPPGIFGYKDGNINDFVYFMQGNKAHRKPLAEAKKLLAEAGYPNGINPKTGKPLVLNYDATSTGSPDDKARFNWMRKQFAKLGIQLNIRSTDYNRFRDKVRNGNAQIFSWGWLADYPDPENFLFLLYGPNAKVKFGGENAANYNNPKVNKLFDSIKSMSNGPARQEKIDQLLQIVRADSPWIWGVHPIDFTLSHQWNRASKPHAMANNTLKYERLHVEKRGKLRKAWNSPILWPIIVLTIFLLSLFIPLVITYWRREKRPNVKRF